MYRTITFQTAVNLQTAAVKRNPVLRKRRAAVHLIKRVLSKKRRKTPSIRKMMNTSRNRRALTGSLFCAEVPAIAKTGGDMVQLRYQKILD